MLYFLTSVWKPNLIQLVGYGADYCLVPEVQMEPLKIHLPVNSLIAVRLSRRDAKHVSNKRVERQRVRLVMSRFLDARDAGSCATTVFHVNQITGLNH